MKKIDFGNLKAGDMIELGAYPQGDETDPDLVRALKKICGEPQLFDGSLWYDYDNANGSAMYADIEYAGKLYRIVYKHRHRNKKSFYYKINRYRDRRTYVFLYEPIVWRVLKIEEGRALLSSQKALDGQEFCVLKKRKPEERDICPNNYEYSYIRRWLNSVFYETAFSDAEKSAIETTVVDNSPETTKNKENYFACNDTEDKVFLLSFQEAKTLFADNKDRYKKATDYAKAMDCYAYPTRDPKLNNGNWLLRSPQYDNENYVRTVGDGGGCSLSHRPAGLLYAVVPAVYIKI
ncbi:MAG: hypothetical protein J1F71_06585 [Clostridiales bacterium]|nr:hypothetical protein [Clostridiales bacterium]